MKKLYALCLFALAAVAYDVFVFRAAPAEAQSRLDPLVVGPADPRTPRQFLRPLTIEGTSLARGRAILETAGLRVVGFSCVNSGNPGNDACYIATIPE
jgi:hypothetical protein